MSKILDMKIEEFLTKLEIASAPDCDQCVTEENTSLSYSVIKDIVKDKESIFNIITILENSQNYSEKVIFLTQSILPQVISKMELSFYTVEMLEQFSDFFYSCIDKFKDNASIFPPCIIAFAKAPNFNPKYIEEIEQLALEILSTPNKEIHEYEFAISTLKSLVSFYNIIDDVSYKNIFFDKVKSVTFPFLDPEFTNYNIPTKILSIYSEFEIYLFDIFTQDFSVLEALLNVLYNVEKLEINELVFNYLRRILKFFNQLFMHCDSNSDHTEQRRIVINEFTQQFLSVLPKVCSFLVYYIEYDPIIRFVAGQIFSLLNRFFNVFRFLESYTSDFDSIFLSIITFSQLSEDDISDFLNNIYNYYNTAFVIEQNSNSNARSNSVILLRSIFENDQSRINQIMEALLTMEEKEEIFFLLANVVDLVEDGQVLEAVHNYVISHFDSFQKFPNHTQFSFIFLAAKSIFLFTEEESTKMLPIAMSYLEESKSEEITPINRFYFTMASEIIQNLVVKYNQLPSEMITEFMELSNLSYSTNTANLIKSIFKINPELFESYQNSIIQHSLSVIQDIILTNELFLSYKEREFVEMNMETLIYQSKHPNPNFPGNEIFTFFNENFENGHLMDFIPYIVTLMTKIIKNKANNYEEIINLAVKFYDQADVNYHNETARPILVFLLYDLDIEQSLMLLKISIKNANAHLSSFPNISDDDSIPDVIACTTLISRLAQLIGESLPEEAFESIMQLIADIREQRNDQVSDFIIYEIAASLTFCNRPFPLLDEIDNYIGLCSSGILNTDYYCHLHCLVLNSLMESFPDRSNDISKLIEILNSDRDSLVNNSAKIFMQKYDDLYSFYSYKAPFE